MCKEKLSNDSMVPSKLKCHLSTKHPTYINKGGDFLFKKLQEKNAKQSNLTRETFIRNEQVCCRDGEYLNRYTVKNFY